MIWIDISKILKLSINLNWLVRSKINWVVYIHNKNHDITWRTLNDGNNKLISCEAWNDKHKLTDGRILPNMWNELQIFFTYCNISTPAFLYISNLLIIPPTRDSTYHLRFSYTCLSTAPKNDVRIFCNLRWFDMVIPTIWTVNYVLIMVKLENIHKETSRMWITKTYLLEWSTRSMIYKT